MRDVPALAAIYDKLQRTRESEESLRETILEFGQKLPFNSVTTYEPSPFGVGFHVVTPDRMGAIPQRAAIIVGELFNHAHSSLEHLMHQLIIRHTGHEAPNPQHIAFPLVNEPEGFDHPKPKTRVAKTLALVAEPMREFLRDLQPFEAAVSAKPGHPIALLKLVELVDNETKHRRLPQLTPLAHEIRFPELDTWGIEWLGNVIEVGKPLVRYRRRAPGYAPQEFDIAVTAALIWQGRPVYGDDSADIVSMSGETINLVEDIVDRAADEFFGIPDLGHA